MQVTQIIVIASALLVLLPPAVAGQVSTDSAAIRLRVEAYLGAWNGRDLAAIGALFSEDADFAMGNQPRVRGRSEIEEWWRDYFTLQEPQRRLAIQIRGLRFLSPDVATMSVTTTTGGTDAVGANLLARQFRGVWVWQQQPNGWYITAMRGLPLEQDEVELNVSRDAAEMLRPDIRGFVAAYADALNAQDPVAVAEFYRDDAEITVRNFPSASGRQEIQTWWRTYFGERSYRALLVVEDVRMIAPRVALLNIIGTGAVSQQAPDGLEPTRYTRATWLLTADADGWKIAELLVLPSESDRIFRRGGAPN